MMIIIIHKPKMKSLGISFCPFIFIKDLNDSQTLAHEKIHIKQQIELLLVFTPILYGLFNAYYYLKGFRGYKLYRRIPFAMEAWEYETKPKERKMYGWLNYI